MHTKWPSVSTNQSVLVSATSDEMRGEACGVEGLLALLLLSDVVWPKIEDRLRILSRLLPVSGRLEVADEDPCRSRCVYRYRRFVHP